MATIIPTEDLVNAAAEFSRREINGAPAVSPIRLVELLRPALSSKGWRFRKEQDLVHLYVVNGDEVVRSSRAELLEILSRAVPHVLRVVVEDGSNPRAVRRANATINAIEGQLPGYKAYLGVMVTALNESFPKLSDSEYSSYLAARQSNRKPAADRSNYFRDRRAALRATRDAEADAVLGEWLEQQAPGRYLLGTAHTVFIDTATETLPENHGARSLGRNNFAKACARLGAPVMEGQARARYIVIPDNYRAPKGTATP